MSTALGLFESPSLKETIKGQFKQIKKSTVTIDTVLGQMTTLLSEKYNVQKNSYEVIVKVDKRKNIDHVKKEVQQVLDQINVPFDMKYLFKVLKGQNEIIVRARRKQK